ncbi:MAG: heat-inducible transcriptional repressor HrcA [Thermoleophilia bacterium]|nr:heat-inducible transcriptional repressor HrcA [Thermoleophilia bacterium]
MTLTQRQQTILSVVAERYIRTGAPVSSKEVARAVPVKVSSSTVRSEFAVLEELGYLTHPHTSAGRTPTETGFRDFVDQLIRKTSLREVAPAPLGLATLAAEVDEALQQTSEAMAQATNLLALVVAPRMSGARLRHVELLLLQPNLVMVVFIVSTGRVTKRVIDFPDAVDQGMVEWARTYLNETIGGSILTERSVRKVLRNPDLSGREEIFLDSLAPALEKLLDEQSEEALYVGGASGLFSEARVEDMTEFRELLRLLEERYMLLRALRSVLVGSKVVVRIGRELQNDSLNRFALVAASYGLPQRNLGTVSLIGPVRMDYEVAIATVRGSAQLLSTFLEDRYE